MISRRFRRYVEERAETGEVEGATATPTSGREVPAGIDPETGRPKRFAYPPNLVVVDGGAPQVAAAQRALDELGRRRRRRSCGLAKRLEEVWLPGEEHPVVLPRTSEGLYLLQRVRDEAHRFDAMCYEHGGMVDDGTLFRLGDNNFRWIGGDDYGGIWLRELAEKLGLKAWVRSSTDQLHNVALQGPKSRDILRQVIWTPPTQLTVDELGWFRFTIGRIGGFDGAPVVVSRTGYTGELGYEIFCHPKDAGTVFDAIWNAGEPHG